MGPGDPFASRPTPPADVPHARAPDNGAPAPPSEPVRVQARTPEPPPTPGPPVRNAPLIGAAVGLGIALLLVLLSPGQAVLVLVLTLVGAALGAMAKNAFGDGVDVGAAWRALRRR